MTASSPVHNAAKINTAINNGIGVNQRAASGGAGGMHGGVYFSYIWHSPNLTARFQLIIKKRLALTSQAVK